MGAFEKRNVEAREGGREGLAEGKSVSFSVGGNDVGVPPHG